jgi:hypothetical protein
MRTIFPKLVRTNNNLPQWITISPRAAYHPFSCTIYLKRKQGIITFIHEYIHHFIHLCYGKKKHQNAWDNFCKKLRKVG